MHILSVRHGFEADHSSSSYEFFALDKLTPEQRAAVRELTGESGHRHLRFHYMGDWSDIPDEWPGKLLAMGYDILVSESYDWWSVQLSLPHDSTLAKRLQQYKCESDGNGFSLKHQIPFSELWKRGLNWETLRGLDSHLQSGCDGCEIAMQCGGARCIARYECGGLFSGDAECLYSRKREAK